MRTLVVAVALTLLVPASAGASTISRSGGLLVYAAGAGERNSVDVEATSPTLLLITDGGATIALDPSSGCSQLDPARPGAGAQCPVDGSTTLVTQLGDGNDSYLAQDGVALPEVVGGGPGDDTVETGAGPDGIDGGAGNDKLDGGAGNDMVLGGDGVDLVRGSGGDDRLDGGPGDDLVDARVRGGMDTVDCTSGGSDAIVRGPSDVLEGCGGAQRASLRVPRQRVRAFADRDGFEFSVSCSRPCAVRWELTPRDRSTRRRIHQRDRRLDKESPRLDAEGFPLYLPAGRNVFHAVPIGRLTKRDVASARRLRLRLTVTVIDRNSLETRLTRDLTIRR